MKKIAGLYQSYLRERNDEIQEISTGGEKNCPCFYRGFPLWFIPFLSSPISYYINNNRYAKYRFQSLKT